ncbi:50S ribosomal protein L11 methyltransferase [candidate division KSB1 bacterium]|nr:50S ribosomal protein L11 methyltransferase [candidate division KSB1 bacterium]
MTSRIDYNNPDCRDALCLSYHYELVSDKKRVTPFRNAIQRVCAGKRVLESGTGSGILSLLAARSGADKVYAVEKDTAVAKFAGQNFSSSPYGDRIQLIVKDVRDVTLADLDGETVDVVIAENLSTWQVTEPQISIMNHIQNGLLAENGFCLPERIDNYIELTFSEYRFEDLIELRTHFFQFSGIPEPRVCSDRALFSQFIFRDYNDPEVDHRVILKPTANGWINSVRLTSPLVVYQNITFDSSDSLMPPVVVPLEKDMQVKEDDAVEVSIRYTTNTRWDRFYCRARIV